MSETEPRTPSRRPSPEPANSGAHAPHCGRSARGHDPNPVQVLRIDVKHEAEALPIEELHVDLGTRLVVVCGGQPHVLFSHTPERVLTEWARCRRERTVATWNPSSSLLRFPKASGSYAIVSVSDRPVRCVLADRANAEAAARLARGFDEIAASVDGHGAHLPPSEARVGGIALPESATSCITTDPGHAVTLTGVKLALAAVRARPGSGVGVRVLDVTGSAVTLERVGADLDEDGTVTAGTERPGRTFRVRCHDAVALASITDDPSSCTLVAEQHLLLAPAGSRTRGTVYLGAEHPLIAFNVALAGNRFVPCARSLRLDALPTADAADDGEGVV